MLPQTWRLKSSEKKQPVISRQQASPKLWTSTGLLDLTSLKIVLFMICAMRTQKRNICSSCCPLSKTYFVYAVIWELAIILSSSDWLTEWWIFMKISMWLLGNEPVSIGILSYMCLLACVSSTSGIAVLWHLLCWCMLKFAACFGVSQSTANALAEKQTSTMPLFPHRSCHEHTTWSEVVKTTLFNASFIKINKKRGVADVSSLGPLLCSSHLSLWSVQQKCNSTKAYIAVTLFIQFTVHYGED
jgi:hypothetical protein